MTTTRTSSSSMEVSGPPMDDVPVVKVEGLLAKPWGVFEEELPTNVNLPQQLEELPDECLSGDSDRPLRHEEDEKGNVNLYSLNPMMFSVVFILLVELLERFSFYGLIYTQTSYLTGVYNKHWNAGLSSVEAASNVSISVAMAYTTPFIGAMLADSIFGDYTSILLGCFGFYLPGLFLIALTTIPGLLGDEFNISLLKWGLLFLWPMGTGIVKSILNVFGAKQFHPLLQSSLIESYYVNFYMCINIGAPAGGIIIPILAQHNVTLAYFIPVIVLSLGVLVFVMGTPRYVRSKPKRRRRNDYFFQRKKRPASSQQAEPSFVTIFMICFLIIPFCIAYSQMATTFIVQGTVMRKAFGVIDAATMNNADAMSVLTFGYLIGNYLFPELRRRNIKIPTTYKFAIGSALGAMSILCALLVEYQIHSTYQASQSQLCVLWQVFSYLFIGMGEIFAVSTAYEIAFKLASPERKARASAINIFCIGGIPNVLCIALYHIGARWFTNSKGTRTISDIEDYVQASVANYFWVLFGICLLGVVVNLLPAVKNFVASVEQDAAVALKTPMMTPKQHPPIRERLEDLDRNERTALIKARSDRSYFKYGSVPALYKQGSFRAGPLLQSARLQPKKRRPPKYMKYGKGLVLYKNTPNMSPVARSELDPKTEQAVHALEKALEGKEMEDPLVLSTSTL